MSQYYSECKECENLYHCFGANIAQSILSGETEQMYLRTESCKDYYPEVKQ